MAGLDLSNIIKSKMVSPATIITSPSSSNVPSDIQFLDSHASGQVGSVGDPFLDDPSFRQKLFAFAQSHFDSPTISILKQLTDASVDQLSDSDRGQLSNVMAVALSQIDIVMAQFNSEDIQHIQLFRDQLESVSRHPNAIMLDLRHRIESEMGMTPEELDFRARAYLVDPTDSTVEAYVNNWLTNGRLQLDQPVTRLVDQVAGLIGQHVRYQTDAPGTDHWQSAKDTLDRGLGDCEDMAILTGSVLMNVLAKTGMSGHEIRDMVQLSAGYLPDRSGSQGHMVVRVRDDHHDLAIDLTQNHHVQSFDNLNMDLVFEFNDRMFLRHQTIDALFTTAFNVTGMSDTDSLTYKIGQYVTDLNGVLNQELRVPSYKGDDLIDPVTGTVIQGSHDFGFYSVNRHKTSGKLQFDYYTFKLNQDAFHTYINETRDKINRITMLLHMGNAIVQARNVESRAIYDQQLSRAEQYYIDANRRSTDKHNQKFMQGFNKFQQRQGQAVQELAQELFTFVQKSNQAQFMDLNMRIESYMRQDPLEGIGGAVVDEMLHIFEVMRSEAQVEVAREDALVQQHNIAVYGRIARDMGERVTLWSTDTTELDRNTEHSVHSYTLDFQQTMDGPATIDAIRKQTTLAFIDHLNDGMSRVDAAVKDVETTGDSREYFFVSRAGLRSDEVTGRDRLLDAHNLFNSSGPRDQYLDINMDQVIQFRDYLTQYQNYVRSVYMMKMSLWEMKRQAAAAIGDKGTSSPVDMAQSSTQGAIDLEMSKQFTFINQYTQQLAGYVEKVNQLVNRAGGFYKAERTETLKGIRLGGMIASSIAADSMAFALSSAAASSLVFAPMAENVFKASSFALNEVFNASNSLAYSMEMRKLERELEEFPDYDIVQEQGHSIYSGDSNADMLDQSDTLVAGFDRDRLHVFGENNRQFFKGAIANGTFKARRYFDGITRGFALSDGVQEEKYDIPTMSALDSGGNRTFVVPRGDGQVVMDKALMASARDHVSFFQQKAWLYITVLKALYDAAENAASAIAGKQKHGTLSKWDAQLSAFLGTESALVETYISEIGMAIQGISQSQSQQEKIYMQTLESVFDAVNLTISSFAAAFGIPASYYSPGIGDMLPLMTGGLKSATSLAHSVLRSKTGRFARLRASLSKRDEDLNVSGTAIKSNGRQVESRIRSDQRLKSRPVTFTERRTDEWFESFWDVDQGRIDDMDPSEAYIKNETIASSVAQLGGATHQVSYTGDRMNVSRLSQEFGLNNGGEYNAFDVVRRGSLEKNLLEERYMIKQFMTNHSQMAYDDFLGLGELPFSQINFQQVAKTSDELNRIFVRRNILMAIEQALYHQRKNVIQQMVGVSIGSNVLDGMVRTVEAYNQSQVTAFDDLVEEFSNRVEAHNAWFMEEATFAIDLTINSMTGLMNLLGFYFYKSMWIKPETFRKLAKRVNRINKAVEFMGMGAKMTFGLMMMFSTRSASLYTNNHFRDEDEEESDDEDAKKREVMNEDKGQDFSGNMTTTSFGKQRMSRGHLSKAQTQLKRKFRQKKIMAEVMAALADAMADVGDAFSGTSSSKAGSALAARTIASYEQAANKVLDSQFKQVQMQADAANRGIDMFRQGAVSSVSTVLQKVVDSTQKRVQKNKKRREKKDAKDVDGVTEQRQGKAEGTTVADSSSSAAADTDRDRVGHSNEGSNEAGHKGTLKAYQNLDNSLLFLSHLLEVSAPLLNQLLTDLLLMVATNDSEVLAYGKAEDRLAVDTEDVELDDQSNSQDQTAVSSTSDIENAVLFSDATVQSQQVMVGQYRDEGSKYSGVGGSYSQRVIKEIRSRSKSHFMNQYKEDQQRDIAGLGRSKGRPLKSQVLSFPLQLIASPFTYLGRQLGQTFVKSGTKQILKRARKIEKMDQKGQLTDFDRKALIDDMVTNRFISPSEEGYKSTVLNDDTLINFNNVASVYARTIEHVYGHKSGLVNQKKTIQKRMQSQVKHSIEQSLIQATSAGFDAITKRYLVNMMTTRDFLDHFDQELMRLKQIQDSSEIHTDDLDTFIQELDQDRLAMNQFVGGHRDITALDFAAVGMTRHDDQLMAMELLESLTHDGRHYVASARHYSDEDRRLSVNLMQLENGLHGHLAERLHHAVRRKFKSNSEDTQLLIEEKIMDVLVAKRHQFHSDRSQNKAFFLKLRREGFIDEYGRIKQSLEQLSQKDIVKRLTSGVGSMTHEQALSVIQRLFGLDFDADAIRHRMEARVSELVQLTQSLERKNLAHKKKYRKLSTQAASDDAKSGVYSITFDSQTNRLKCDSLEQEPHHLENKMVLDMVLNHDDGPQLVRLYIDMKHDESILDALQRDDIPTLSGLIEPADRQGLLADLLANRREQVQLDQRINLLTQFQNHFVSDENSLVNGYFKYQQEMDLFHSLNTLQQRVLTRPHVKVTDLMDSEALKQAHYELIHHDQLGSYFVDGELTLSAQQLLDQIRAYEGLTDDQHTVLSRLGFYSKLIQDYQCVDLSSGLINFDRVRLLLGMGIELESFQDALMMSDERYHLLLDRHQSSATVSQHDQMVLAFKASIMGDDELERLRAREQWANLANEAAIYHEKVAQLLDIDSQPLVTVADRLAVLRLIMGVSNASVIAETEQYLDPNKNDALVATKRIGELMGWSESEIDQALHRLRVSHKDLVTKYRENMLEHAVTSFEDEKRLDGHWFLKQRTQLASPNGGFIKRSIKSAIKSGLDAFELAGFVQQPTYNEASRMALIAEKNGLNRGQQAKRMEAIMDRYYSGIVDYDGKRKRSVSDAEKYAHDLKKSEKQLKEWDHLFGKSIQSSTVRPLNMFQFSHNAEYRLAADKLKGLQKQILQTERDASLTVALYLERNDSAKAVDFMLGLASDGDHGLRLASRILQQLAYSKGHTSDDYKVSHKFDHMIELLIDKSGEEPERAAVMGRLLGGALNEQNRFAEAKMLTKRSKAWTPYMASFFKKSKHMLHQRYRDFGFSFSNDREASAHTTSRFNQLNSALKGRILNAIGSVRTNESDRLIDQCVANTPDILDDFLNYASDESITAVLQRLYVHDRLEFERLSERIKRSADTIQFDRLQGIEDTVRGESSDPHSQWSVRLEGLVSGFHDQLVGASQSPSRFLQDIRQQLRKESIPNASEMPHLLRLLASSIAEMAEEELLAGGRDVRGAFIELFDGVDGSSFFGWVEGLSEVRRKMSFQDFDAFLTDLVQSIEQNGRSSTVRRWMQALTERMSSSRSDHQSSAAVIADLNDKLGADAPSTQVSQSLIVRHDVQQLMVMAQDPLQLKSMAQDPHLMSQLARVLVMGFDRYGRLLVELVQLVLPGIYEAGNGNVQQFVRAIKDVYGELEEQSINLQHASFKQLKETLKESLAKDKSLAVESFKSQLDTAFPAQPFITPVMMMRQRKDIYHIRDWFESMDTELRSDRVIEMVKSDPGNMASLLVMLQSHHITHVHAYDTLESVLTALRTTTDSPKEMIEFLQRLEFEMLKSQHQYIGNDQQHISIHELDNERKRQTLINHSFRMIDREDLALEYSDSFAFLRADGFGSSSLGGLAGIDEGYGPQWAHLLSLLVRESCPYISDNLPIVQALETISFDSFKPAAHDVAQLLEGLTNRTGMVEALYQFCQFWNEDEAVSSVAIQYWFDHLEPTQRNYFVGELSDQQYDLLMMRHHSADQSNIRYLERLESIYTSVPTLPDERRDQIVNDFQINLSVLAENRETEDDHIYFLKQLKRHDNMVADQEAKIALSLENPTDSIPSVLLERLKASKWQLTGLNGPNKMSMPFLSEESCYMFAQLMQNLGQPFFDHEMDALTSDQLILELCKCAGVDHQLGPVAALDLVLQSPWLESIAPGHQCREMIQSIHDVETWRETITQLDKWELAICRGDEQDVEVLQELIDQREYLEHCEKNGLFVLHFPHLRALYRHIFNQPLDESDQFALDLSSVEYTPKTLFPIQSKQSDHDTFFDQLQPIMRGQSDGNALFSYFFRGFRTHTDSASSRYISFERLFHNSILGTHPDGINIRNKDIFADSVESAKGWSRFQSALVRSVEHAELHPVQEVAESLLKDSIKLHKGLLNQSKSGWEKLVQLSRRAFSRSENGELNGQDIQKILMVLKSKETEMSRIWGADVMKGLNDAIDARTVMDQLSTTTTFLKTLLSTQMSRSNDILRTQIGSAFKHLLLTGLQHMSHQQSDCTDSMRTVLSILDDEILDDTGLARIRPFLLDARLASTHNDSIPWEDLILAERGATISDRCRSIFYEELLALDPLPDHLHPLVTSDVYDTFIDILSLDSPHLEETLGRVDQLCRSTGYALSADVSPFIVRWFNRYPIDHNCADRLLDCLYPDSHDTFSPMIRLIQMVDFAVSRDALIEAVASRHSMSRQDVIDELVPDQIGRFDLDDFEASPGHVPVHFMNPLLSIDTHYDSVDAFAQELVTILESDRIDSLQKMHVMGLWCTQSNQHALLPVICKNEGVRMAICRWAVTHEGEMSPAIVRLMSRHLGLYLTQPPFDSDLWNRQTNRRLAASICSAFPKMLRHISDLEGATLAMDAMTKSMPNRSSVTAILNHLASGHYLNESADLEGCMCWILRAAKQAPLYLAKWLDAVHNAVNEDTQARIITGFLNHDSPIAVEVQRLGLVDYVQDYLLERSPIDESFRPLPENGSAVYHRIYPPRLSLDSDSDDPIDSEAIVFDIPSDPIVSDIPSDPIVSETVSRIFQGNMDAVERIGFRAHISEDSAAAEATLDQLSIQFTGGADAIVQDMMMIPSDKQQMIFSGLESCLTDIEALYTHSLGGASLRVRQQIDRLFERVVRQLNDSPSDHLISLIMAFPVSSVIERVMVPILLQLSHKDRLRVMDHAIQAAFENPEHGFKYLTPFLVGDIRDQSPYIRHVLSQMGPQVIDGFSARHRSIYLDFMIQLINRYSTDRSISRAIRAHMIAAEPMMQSLWIQHIMDHDEPKLLDMLVQVSHSSLNWDNQTFMDALLSACNAQSLTILESSVETNSQSSAALNTFLTRVRHILDQLSGQNGLRHFCSLFVNAVGRLSIDLDTFCTRYKVERSNAQKAVPTSTAIVDHLRMLNDQGVIEITHNDTHLHFGDVFFNFRSIDEEEGLFTAKEVSSILMPCLDTLFTPEVLGESGIYKQLTDFVAANRHSRRPINGLVTVDKLCDRYNRSRSPIDRFKTDIKKAVRRNERDLIRVFKQEILDDTIPISEIVTALFDIPNKGSAFAIDVFNALVNGSEYDQTDSSWSRMHNFAIHLYTLIPDTVPFDRFQSFIGISKPGHYHSVRDDIRNILDEPISDPIPSLHERVRDMDGLIALYVESLHHYKRGEQSDHSKASTLVQDVLNYKVRMLGLVDKDDLTLNAKGYRKWAYVHLYHQLSDDYKSDRLVQLMDDWRTLIGDVAPIMLTPPNNFAKGYEINFAALCLTAEGSLDHDRMSLLIGRDDDIDTPNRIECFVYLQRMAYADGDVYQHALNTIGVYMKDPTKHRNIRDILIHSKSLSQKLMDRVGFDADVRSFPLINPEHIELIGENTGDPKKMMRHLLFNMRD